MRNKIEFYIENTATPRKIIIMGFFQKKKLLN